LQPLLNEQRWLLYEYRQVTLWQAKAHTAHPAVVLMQAEWVRGDSMAWGLLRELTVRNPDARTVVIQDTKINDEQRPVFVAAVCDLGARLVLTPPFTRAVLEDAVSGLMRDCIRRFVLGQPQAPIDLAARPDLEAD
jgi:hypothetical protein